MSQPSPKYSITKRVEFAASHRLLKLSADHQCSRLHGHNYVVEVTASSYQLDDTGFVLDFGVISKLIKTKFDHQDLNERMRENPTAENLAMCIGKMVFKHIFDIGEEGTVWVDKVTVWETSTCSATIEFPIS
jgi:6-pyruvoyltetrahydropterin/6-carboxytetrahydropterin synthase